MPAGFAALAAYGTVQASAFRTICNHSDAGWCTPLPRSAYPRSQWLHGTGTGLAFGGVLVACLTTAVVAWRLGPRLRDVAVVSTVAVAVALPHVVWFLLSAENSWHGFAEKVFLLVLTGWTAWCGARMARTGSAAVIALPRVVVMTASLVQPYAELVVRVGAAVVPGTVVYLRADVAHLELARAVAEQAYAAGARQVHVDYEDGHVRLAALRHAPDDALREAPRWQFQKIDDAEQERAAFIRLTGNPEPHLFEGIDPARVAAMPVELALHSRKVMLGGDVTWTIVAAPNPGWATQVFGEPDVERLWEAVAIPLRLHEPDVVEAWAAAPAHPRGARRRAGRARPGRRALPRRRHRPHRRSDPGLPLDRRRADHVGRADVHAEPADRGGVHQPGPLSRRGRGRTDPAAGDAPRRARWSRTWC